MLPFRLAWYYCYILQLLFATKTTTTMATRAQLLVGSLIVESLILLYMQAKAAILKSRA